jgi:hypothetical protein
MFQTVKPSFFVCAMHRKERIMSAFGNSGFSPADMAAVLRNNNGDGFGGNNIWWAILWIMMMMCGGWGNGGWNNGGQAPAQVAADVQRGFDQQATTSQISNLQSQLGQGFADAAVAQCQGNANITQAITNGQYATAQAITAAKDTVAQGMNTLGMSLLQGNCDNKAGLADVKYTVATEACADRNAVSNGIRDVITAGTANTQNILNGLNEVIRSQQQGTQSIVDKLCQLELDNFKRENADLRSRLQMADLAASQQAQTAAILQGQNAQAQNILNTCCPPPKPAYIVSNPNGCGCGNLYGGCGA